MTATTALLQPEAMTDGVVVNEVRVHAVDRVGARWLTLWLSRRPHNAAQQTITGAVLWLPCEDPEAAVETEELLWRHMVPRAAMRAASLDADRAIPLRALRAVGCMKADRPLPLHPDGWIR